MTEQPAAVVRRFFERYQQAGVDGALELITPETVLVVPPEASAEPDTYEGADGGRRYFAGFEGALDDVRFDLVDVEEIPPDIALAEMRLLGRGDRHRGRADHLPGDHGSRRDDLADRRPCGPQGGPPGDRAQPALVDWSEQRRPASSPGPSRRDP